MHTNTMLTMSRITAGMIFKIISGTYEGKYGVAIYAEQALEVRLAGKLIVNVFDDVDLTTPTLKEDKPVKSLFTTERLERIGFQD